MTTNTGMESLLSPDNCTMLLIDYEPQMFFGVQSIDRQLLMNNVIGLAKAANLFDIPVILTTISADTFSGPFLPEVTELFPNTQVIDRTSMNSWEDSRVVGAVEKAGRKKLVMGALWTEVCLAFPAISAQGDGYQVYAVADASGGTSVEVHNTAILRMAQQGIIPVTWLQVMLELQRDWARPATYDAVMQILLDHAGAYGQGVLYAKSMIPH
jgi:nicotinamidase-related amidase